MSLHDRVAPRDMRRAETGRQVLALEGEKWPRLVLTSLAYALCAPFGPAWLLILLWAINMVADLLCMRALRLYTHGADARLYPASLVLTYLMGLVYTAAAGSVWIAAEGANQALAVGMVGCTLIHLATLRAIDLRGGFVGLAGVATALIGVAALYWLPSGQWVPFGVGLAAIGGGIGYCATAMRSTHALHRAAAADRAEAQAANDAKGLFLAQMSHELRTPLNAILGLSLTERDRAHDASSRLNLGIVAEAAQGLGHILDDILDMSAIRAGRVALRPENAAPLPIIEATVALFRPQAEASGARLDLVVSENLPTWASFDPNRLRQCLANLLSNAVKHAAAGRIAVSADYRGGILTVDVTDTGIGIPPDQQDNIFTAFGQYPAAKHGTGLGLSISRALARQMGGDLTLQSGGAGNTCFRLQVAMPAMGAPAPKPVQMPVNLAGRTVLVVDDIATNRFVAASHLRQLGANIAQADSGPAALERLAKGDVDLVLLDMHMPGMSGDETLKAIRASKGPHLPVLGVTAALETTREVNSFLARVDGVVLKPFTTAALTDEIARLLNVAV